MAAVVTGIGDNRLRAPREHGKALVQPAFDSVADVLRENLAIRDEYASYDVQGQSLRELSEEAHCDLLFRATKYTQAYRDVPKVPVDDGATTIVLAGHQPQLYHPGVWFKSFALDALAARHNAIAIQLLTDNDSVRSSSIRVPGGSVAEPKLETVPFDRSSREIPYEERSILDNQTFESFARNVQRTISPIVPDPIVNQLWPGAIEAARGGARLGHCIAQARHRLEGAWGLTTLEIPLSHLCDAMAFHRFTAHVLANLHRFHPIYNSSLKEYRKVHRIRSRSHPVPDLGVADEWLEAPFWIWSEEHPVRRRLMVCRQAERVRVIARPTPGVIPPGDVDEIVLELAADGDLESSVGVLASLRDRGIKIRPRALLTTMYARLVLGNLFLHGIGGAKYDQLTDMIIQRFFNIGPPRFLTVTATFLLPIDLQPVRAEDARRIDGLMRDLWYHPERHLDLANCTPAMRRQVDDFVLNKRRWISARPPRGRRLRRHQEITQLNSKLRKHVSAQRERLMLERSRLTRQMRKDAILTSREFPFCLFPEKSLRQPLLELSAQSS